MKKTIWTLQILLALAFTGAGLMKLATAPATLRANPAMGWSTQFTDLQIKAIGAAELTGAAGLILPALTGVAPVLTSAAAVGLSLLMAGAVSVHLQRGEPPVAPVILGVLVVTLAVLRLTRRGGAGDPALQPRSAPQR